MKQVSDIAITLLLSGWHCSSVPFTKVYYDDEYIILRVDGEPHEPVTGLFDLDVRIDINGKSKDFSCIETIQLIIYINLYKGVSHASLFIWVESEVLVIFVQIFGHLHFTG